MQTKGQTGYRLQGGELKLADHTIYFNGTVDTGGKVPTFAFDAGADQIDVPKLLAAATGGKVEEKPAAQPAAAKGDGRVFPNDPLPLDGLRSANGEFKLGTGALILPKGVKMHDVQILATRITSYNVCYTKLLRYGVLASLDIESYRGTIIKAAEDATGRKVAIAGPMKLKISFSPAVVIEGVEISNPTWAKSPAFAKVGRAEAEIALIPALRITSYNVCYTKLLRPRARGGRPARAADRPGAGAVADPLGSYNFV